jgi:hypothetical protein
MPPCGGSRPMGQIGTPAGLQTNRSGAFQKIWPPVRPDRNSGVVGRLAPRRIRQESEALLSAPLGTSDLLPASEAAGPWGAREAGCRCRLPRDSADAGHRPVADTERIDAGRTGSASLRLRTAMLRVGSRDCRAVKLLSTQIVRSTGESIWSPTSDAIACRVVVNAFQQYEPLLSLATANK